MNTINISDIFLVKNNPKNKIKLSSKDYYKETKEHINQYLIKVLPRKQISRILNNDDLFCDITTAIIIADWTFNNNLSSKSYWRTKNCLWAIISGNKNFFKNLKIKNAIYDREKEISRVSQNFEKEIDNKDEEEYNLSQIKSLLSNRDYEIYKSIHINNLTQKETAKIFNMTQQNINLILKKIKEKLRNNIHE